MFRAAIASGSEIGKIAKRYMDAGELCPPSIGHTMLHDRLAQPDVVDRGYILDGFPREAANSEFLVSEGARDVASSTPLARDGIAWGCVRVRMRALIPGQLPDVIVVLEVPDEELVKRLSGRRFDPVTKRTYHVIFAPPSDPEVAARLTQRVDDCAEVAVGRIAKYRAALADCLAPFEGLAPTATVDGTGSVDTVFERIRAVVDSCAT